MKNEVEIKIVKKTDFERDLLNLSEENVEIKKLVEDEISRLELKIRQAFFQDDSKKEARKCRKSIKQNYSIFNERYYLGFYYNKQKNTLILYNIEQLSEKKKKLGIIHRVRTFLWFSLFLNIIVSVGYFLYFFGFEKGWMLPIEADRRTIVIWSLFLINLISAISAFFTAKHELNKKRWQVSSKTIFGKLKALNLENLLNQMTTKTVIKVFVILFVQLFLTILYAIFSPPLKILVYIIAIYILFFIVNMSMVAAHPLVIVFGFIVFYLVGLLDVTYWAMITPVLSLMGFFLSNEIWKLTLLTKDPLNEVKSLKVKMLIDKKIFRLKIFLTILPSFFYLYLKLTENLQLFSKLVYFIEKLSNNFSKFLNSLLHTTSKKANVSELPIPIEFERGISRVIMFLLIVLMVNGVIKIIRLITAYDENEKHLTSAAWLHMKLVKIMETEVLGIIDKVYSVKEYIFYKGKILNSTKQAPKFPTRRRKH